jgi:hypothetical protein
MYDMASDNWNEDDFQGYHQQWVPVNPQQAASGASTDNSVLTGGWEVDGGPLPYHTDDSGARVGDYPGEVDCSGSNGCTVWNPNTEAWSLPGEVDVYPPAAQGVFQTHGQVFRNADGTMKAVTAVYAIGFTVVGGGAVVGGLPTMEIAVGAGEPFHVAYGVGGTWLNAVGNTLGDMTVSGFMASDTAATAWFTVSVPILNEAAVLATESCPAWSCATAALSALGKGWIP